jgi:hypothetical protein
MAVGLVFAETRRSTRLVRHPLALVLIKPLLRRALHRVLRHKKSGPRAVALFLDLHGLETSGFSGLLPPSGKKAALTKLRHCDLLCSFVVLPVRAGSSPTGLPSTIMVPRLSFGMRDTRRSANCSTARYMDVGVTGTAITPLLLKHEIPAPKETSHEKMRSVPWEAGTRYSLR